MTGTRGPISRKRLDELLDLRARIDAEIDDEMRAIRQRVQERARQRGVTRQKVAACGTPSGYYRHRRQLLEPACDACKKAHSVAERDREARRRARQEVAA